ncbi:MAG TPA: hypothetical protein VNA20_14995 [Frankiaceae bacterium]|nr:hypothetical protein [Frankiaceae bacterium]
MKSKIAACALVIVTTTAVTVIPATDALARPCADATDLGAAPASSGGAVSVVAPEEWWTQTSSVTRTVTLQPQDNGVDLAVRAGSCDGPVLCTSATPGLASESCVVSYDGRLVILALYSPATPGASASGYVVSVTETPGAEPNEDHSLPHVPSKCHHSWLVSVDVRTAD